MADATVNGAVRPRGAKPKRRLSGRNIMIYGILGLVCLYYLLPLWVCLLYTSRCV